MALVYKGEMPSCCAVCCDCNSAEDGNFCNRTGNRLRNDWQLYRPLNCPIIGELPDKHGRIVDLDKVLNWLINEDRRFSMAMSAKIDNALKNAPVILEANNE